MYIKMKNLNKFILLTVVGFISSLVNESFGQSDPIIGLYRFNPQFVSPTNAGFEENNRINLSYRNQWANLEGTPVTFGMTANIKWKENKGLGVNIISDQIGPYNLSLVQGDFAYHAQLSEELYLSTGLRLGAGNYSYNFDGRLIDPNDPNFSSEISNGLRPLIGWGVQLAKKDQGFFISFSQPRITRFKLGEDVENGFRDITYSYLMSGTKIALGNEVSTKRGRYRSLTIYPSILFRIAKDVPLSTDINLNANLKGLVDIGGSIRLNDSYGIRLGVQATNRIYVGYLYEIPSSLLSNIVGATNEFALRYSF